MTLTHLFEHIASRARYRIDLSTLINTQPDIIQDAFIRNQMDTIRTSESASEHYADRTTIVDLPA